MKENSLVLIYISLKISYVSLQIYSLRSFDEVREECGWFQDTKGFCVNWSREVGIFAKKPQLTSQPLDADIMVKNGGW